MNNIKIDEPKTTTEFDAYYRIRWEILRKPWNQPIGSEKDDLERNAIHLAAFSGEEIVGCIRGHFNSFTQAQIRYMAVAESFRNQGIGSLLLKELEEKLAERGAKEVILKAREKAVSFYEKNGYRIFKDGDVIFGEIAHFWMRKVFREFRL